MCNMNTEIVVCVVYSPPGKWWSLHSPSVGILWSYICLPGSHVWSPRGGLPKYDHQGGWGGSGMPYGKCIPDQRECITFFFRHQVTSNCLISVLKLFSVCVNRYSSTRPTRCLAPHKLHSPERNSTGCSASWTSDKDFPVAVQQNISFSHPPQMSAKSWWHISSAWKSMGLEGNPNFTDVRTCIASHVSVFSRFGGSYFRDIQFGVVS